MAVFLQLLIAGILVAVPATAVLQVFLKFLREIYKTSLFYHAGQATLDEAPAETPEVIAKAADPVLSQQVEVQNGDEPLAPKHEDDDRVGRESIA